MGLARNLISDDEWAFFEGFIRGVRHPNGRKPADHRIDEGLRAELADGTVVGKVREIVHSPAGELLSIDHDGREVLVPFVKAIVPAVDVAGGRVVLNPPEGLLDA